MDNNKKNVRIGPDVYEKLKEIKFFTNENFSDSTAKAIEMYYKKLKSEGKLMKG
ncbi:TPA: hypothetical protein PBT65_001734 [Staphylococcus aureus]|nr:hypothetical protein [Staphylococcus aureus]